MIPLLVAALLTVQGLAAAPRPAAPRAGLSRDEADALDVKLEAIDKRQKNGRTARSETVEISESELNSYVNLKLKMPDGVTDVAVHLDRERVAATAIVDLEKVQAKPASSSWNPMSLLGGRVPVSLRGKLVNQDDGFASIEFEEIKLGALPLAPSALEQIVLSATKNRENPQGLDILSPFRLPYSLKRVRLQPGRALLEF
jgi:hypothetical protein